MGTGGISLLSKALYRKHSVRFLWCHAYVTHTVQQGLSETNCSCLLTHFMWGEEHPIRLQPFRKGPGDYSEAEGKHKPGYILLLEKQTETTTKKTNKTSQANNTSKQQQQNPQTLTTKKTHKQNQPTNKQTAPNTTQSGKQRQERRLQDAWSHLSTAINSLHGPSWQSRGDVSPEICRAIEFLEEAQERPRCRPRELEKSLNCRALLLDAARLTVSHTTEMTERMRLELPSPILLHNGYGDHLATPVVKSQGNTWATSVSPPKKGFMALEIRLCARDGILLLGTTAWKTMKSKAVSSLLPLYISLLALAWI